MRNIYLIISREYLERVRKKSFIIVTLLMPLFMIAIMVAPSLMMLYGTSLRKAKLYISAFGSKLNRIIYKIIHYLIDKISIGADAY